MAKRENSLPFDGERLRTLRERAGLLQTDLARRCTEIGHPVDRTRISQLENPNTPRNKRKPSPPLLRALSQALEVEVDELLTPATPSAASDGE